MKNIEEIRKFLNELRETLYLSSIPGFVDNINNIRKQKIGIRLRILIKMKNGKFFYKL